MMEKAIKQRLLGGLVLVAGAALFLPVLLDGSGAALTIPPMPKAPEVGGVEAMAPRLDQKVAETEQAVDAAHAGREEAAADAAPAAAGEAADVAPDAAAVAAGEGKGAAPAPGAGKPAAAAAAPVAGPGVAPAAKPLPAVARAVPGPAPAAVPAKPAAAAAVGTPANPAATKVPATPVATVPVAPARPAAPPEAARAPAKPEPARADAARPAVDKPADKPLPGAWLVQVGVFSSRDKAQGLVQQLRHKGYSAVLHPQGNQFKVVVGPELSRSVADSIKTRLAADPELKLNAWVQAYKP